MKGKGDMVLIYPAATAFQKPLPEFYFGQDHKLCLRVVPFDLETQQLHFEHPALTPLAAA